MDSTTELLLEVLPYVKEYYQNRIDAALLRGEGQRMELLEQEQNDLVERIEATDPADPRNCPFIEKPHPVACKPRCCNCVA